MGKARRYRIGSVQRASMALEPKNPVAVEAVEPRGSGNEERSPVRGCQVRHAYDADIPAEAFGVARRYIGTITGDGNTTNAIAALLPEMDSPVRCDVGAMRALGAEGIDNCGGSGLHWNRQYIFASVHGHPVQPKQGVTQQELAPGDGVAVRAAPANQYDRLGDGTDNEQKSYELGFHGGYLDRLMVVDPCRGEGPAGGWRPPAGTGGATR